MVRWGMVIDLRRCFGCQSCTIACRSENATPRGIFWRRVLEKELGKYPSARRVYYPLQCMHCKNPPCVRACPAGAFSKREDGIVLIDYNKCYGARFCITVCPYDAISLYGKRWRYSPFEIKEWRYYPSALTPYEKVGYMKFQVGVPQKCNFCVERLERGWQPACVQTCPTNAIYIGDLDDPDSEVSRLIRQRNGYQLRPELGTDPSIYYLP